MFDWIKELFSKSATGPWLTDGKGHDLHWAQSELPVNVYLDTSLLSRESGASALASAFGVVRWINSNVGHNLLLMPVAVDMSTLNAMASERGRLELRQTIVITATDDPMSDLSSAFCHADLRYDYNRNGEIRNCAIDWLVTGRYIEDVQTLAHETFHALGCAHSATGVMAPKRKRAEWEEPSSDLFASLKEKYR
jgi:hypothetical protein